MRKLAFWFSLILLFMIPWENSVKIANLGTLTRAAGILIAGFWLLTILATGEMRRLRPFHLVIFAFLLWNIVTVVWTVSLSLTMDRLQTYVQLIIMFWLIWDLYNTPENVRLGLQAYILGGYVSLYSVIGNYLAGKSTGRGWVRYTGSNFNENELAMILSIGVPIAWHLAVSIKGSSKKDNFLRAANYAYIPLAVFSILLSASRTGLVSLMPAFWFILGSFARLRPASRILIALGLTLSLIFLQPLVPQTSIDRLSTAESEVTEGNIGGRTIIWEQGLNAFLERPITGVGVGAFRAAITLNKVAHNTYLSILTETGVVGSVLFILILLLAIFHARRQDKWSAWLWLTVLLSWAIGLTTLTWDYKKPTWFVLGFVFASAHALPQIAAQSPIVSRLWPDSETQPEKPVEA